MFGNTLTLPHADGNIVLIKINQDSYASEYLYRGSLSEVRARIRHTKTKASGDRPSYDRHNVEITRTVFATEAAPEYTRKVYVVIEQLPNDSDVKETDALCDWLIATANANTTSLLNWES